MTRDNPTTLISKYSHHLIQCTIVQQNEHPLSSLNNLWCSFMHIIDYDIISSCVLNPIIHQYSFMHIIDYDIIRFCALNPICHWCSLLIHAYHYHLAVHLPMQQSNCSSNKSMQLSTDQKNLSSSALIVKLMHIIIICKMNSQF